MNNVCYLVAEQSSHNDYGVLEPAETKTKIYCDVASISASEFYSAANNGIKPEYKIIIFAPEYNGETIVEYNGGRYYVYRTYRAGDKLELYIEQKAGVNN